MTDQETLPGEELELDIPQERQHEMVTMYVTQMMLPETLAMYNARLEADEDVRQALYDAVVNECVNIILKAEVARNAEDTTDATEE